MNNTQRALKLKSEGYFKAINSISSYKTFEASDYDGNKWLGVPMTLKEHLRLRKIAFRRDIGDS